MTKTLPTNDTGQLIPPITMASKIIIDHINLPPSIVRELSIAAGRFNRKKFLIMTKEWIYWNRVVRHIKNWDGEFKH